MARDLGVRSAWLREEAERGAIPHVAAGTTMLFDADAVRRVLLERARQMPDRRDNLAAPDKGSVG